MTARRKSRELSPRAVGDALQWKLRQVLMHPLAAGLVRDIGLTVDVNIRRRGRGFVAAVTMRAPMSVRSARKHVRDAADPAKFADDLAKAVSVITIERDDSESPTVEPAPN